MSSRKKRNLCSQYKSIGIIFLGIIALGLLIINGYDQAFLGYASHGDNFDSADKFTVLLQNIKKKGYIIFGTFAAIAAIYLFWAYKLIAYDIKSLDAFLSKAAKTNLLINKDIFTYREFQEVAAKYNLLVKERMQDYKETTNSAIEILASEKKLSEEIAHVKSVIRHIPFPLYMIDGTVDRRAFLVNNEMVKFFGHFEESDLLGRKEEELYFCSACDIKDCKNKKELDRVSTRRDGNTYIEAVLCRRGSLDSYTIVSSDILDNQGKRISTLCLIIPKYYDKE